MRRIEAFKALAKTDVPAHIVNLDDITNGEISENAQRKDFSLEEIIQIKKALEPEIKKESEKKMLSGKPLAAQAGNEAFLICDALFGIILYLSLSLHYLGLFFINRLKR